MNFKLTGVTVVLTLSYGLHAYVLIVSVTELVHGQSNTRRRNNAFSTVIFELRNVKFNQKIIGLCATAKSSDLEMHRIHTTWPHSCSFMDLSPGVNTDYSDL